MKERRRKILLPKIDLVRECSIDTPNSHLAARLVSGKKAEYSFCPVLDPVNDSPRKYSFFPVVLGKNSVPWGLAAHYLLSCLELDFEPNMKTYLSRAEDLGAFKEWLDGHTNPNSVLIDFPNIKQKRTTYRFRAHLVSTVYAGEIALSTANRRMGAVIKFYRWLIHEKYFEPDHEPWQEKTLTLGIDAPRGSKLSKKVVSTDLSIRAPSSSTITDATIKDGGRLRPLTPAEQRWVIDGLREIGNTEMLLLCLLMLFTGARIQTAATIRYRHFSEEDPGFSRSLTGLGDVFRLKVGPGTGIDTKFDRNMVLQIPRPLYEALHVYACSKRSQRRRLKSPIGDKSENYLFLTQQGTPYYSSRSDLNIHKTGFELRQQKDGGTVRQFLRDRLIPYIQKKYSCSFSFSVHDLRATFGMNKTDQLLALVESEKISLPEARKIVSALMGHASTKTTDDYLQYRDKIDAVEAAINDYGEQFDDWIAEAAYGRDLATDIG